VILTQFGVASEDDLATCLHREYRVPLVDLSTVDPPAEVLRLVPPEMARQHAILPIGLAGSTLTVAIADPSNLDGLAAVKFRSGCELRVTLAPARSLMQAIERFYAERVRETG
jgi:type IV pilus assembly protein PilB